MRIRIENFIGILKQRYKILNSTIVTEDIGIMDEIFFTCCMLQNFGYPTIN
jgi:hypothetical protein